MNDWLLKNLLRLIYDLSKQDTMQRIDVTDLKTQIKELIGSDKDISSIFQDHIALLCKKNYIVMPTENLGRKIWGQSLKMDQI